MYARLAIKADNISLIYEQYEETITAEEVSSKRKNLGSSDYDEHE